MKNSLKVFLSCAVGAFTGSLVALQLTHNFWWIGAIAGFTIGYLIINFNTVVSATPVAWRSAVEHARQYKENFEWPDWGYWAQVIFLPVFLFASASVPIALMARLVKHVQNPMTFQEFVFLFFQAIVSICAGIMAPMKDVTCVTRTDQLAQVRRVTLRYNPIGFPIFLLYILFYWIPKKTILLLKKYAPAAFEGTLVLITICVVALGHFIKYLFLQIHSDLRLLCGTDAAVGATIGYFCHNALIGAVAGGLLGLLNYEVVSKRILHLDVRPAN